MEVDNYIKNIKIFLEKTEKDYQTKFGNNEDNIKAECPEKIIVRKILNENKDVINIFNKIKNDKYYFGEKKIKL